MAPPAAALATRRVRPDCLQRRNDFTPPPHLDQRHVAHERLSSAIGGGPEINIFRPLPDECREVLQVDFPHLECPLQMDQEVQMVPRRIRNRLLAALSPTDLTELSNELQPANLAKSQILYEVGEPFDFIYFIEEGFASMLATMKNGTSSEVGMIGPEGLIGAPALLGGRVSAQRVIMQLPGTALRISAAACKLAFYENRSVRAVLLRFIEDLLNLSSRTAGCNRLHLVEQHSARWLLMASDRLGADVLPLTQEVIAATLGVRRSGISEAAGGLQRSGLIRYRRGEITIIDRAGLKKTACECYRLDRQRVEQGGT
jgi:CRP-like cAMP-binding protein